MQLKSAVLACFFFGVCEAIRGETYLAYSRPCRSSADFCASEAESSLETQKSCLWASSI